MSFETDFSLEVIKCFTHHLSLEADQPTCCTKLIFDQSDRYPYVINKILNPFILFPD